MNKILSGRWQTIGRLCALLYVTLLNVMVIVRFWDDIASLQDDYRTAIFKAFHISGFDPYSYLVLSEWYPDYNIYRHPLLAFFMWLPAQLNAALHLLTGVNFATVIMGCILVACAYTTFIYMVKLLHRVVGTTEGDAWLLTSMLFSFGYIMVTVSVPDHFCLSMMMLTLVLYLSGKEIKEGRPMPRWQAIALFFFTAGISLNNGIKVFLSNLFVNGKRFWHPVNLLLTVILPAALIWGFARWEWKTYERPRYVARQEAKAKTRAKKKAKIYQQAAAQLRTTDSALIKRKAKAMLAHSDSVYQARINKRASIAHMGRPMAHGEFSQWTDITTPRGWSLIENVCGEPIQLHTDHLLGDVLVNRPVIVHYSYAFNYVVEALVLLLFLAGVWAGRRSRFLWLALSFMAFDIVIHVVLGFGLNEAYIMSAHWLIVVPIAVAYLLRGLRSRGLAVFRILILLLVAYLVIYNGLLYGQYLLG